MAGSSCVFQQIKTHLLKSKTVKSLSKQLVFEKGNYRMYPCDSWVHSDDFMEDY